MEPVTEECDRCGRNMKNSVTSVSAGSARCLKPSQYSRMGQDGVIDPMAFAKCSSLLTDGGEDTPFDRLGIVYESIWFDGVHITRLQVFHSLLLTFTLILQRHWIHDTDGVILPLVESRKSVSLSQSESEWRSWLVKMATTPMLVLKEMLVQTVTLLAVVVINEGNSGGDDDDTLMVIDVESFFQQLGCSTANRIKEQHTVLFRV